MVLFLQIRAHISEMTTTTGRTNINSVEIFPNPAREKLL